MNANLIAAIKAVIEQVLSEKDLVTRDELNSLVAQRVSAELDIIAPVSELTAVSEATRALAAPSDRKPAQSQNERRRKRAEYQKKYRARERAARKGGTEEVKVDAAPEIKLAAPTPKVAEPALVKAEAPAPPALKAPPATKNGAHIAYVPSVDLDI